MAITVRTNPTSRSPVGRYGHAVLSLILVSPIVLTAVVLMAVVSLFVWVGRWTSWFGRRGGWTVVVWPLPLVTLVAPIVAGVVGLLVRAVGLEGAEGSLGAGLVYLLIATVPWALLTVAPPRWLFPPWARARIAEPPAVSVPPAVSEPVTETVLTAPSAVPAVYCPRGRGHGGRSRWMWRIDGVSGHVWVDENVLRFRPSGDHDDPDGSATSRTLDDELDSDAIAQLDLQFGPDGQIHLQAPRGGWWTRRRFDVDLSVVTGVAWSAVRRSARGSLLTLEVADRGAVHVWVTDTASVRSWLTHERDDHGGQGVRPSR